MTRHRFDSERIVDRSSQPGRGPNVAMNADTKLDERCLMQRVQRPSRLSARNRLAGGFGLSQFAVSCLNFLK